MNNNIRNGDETIRRMGGKRHLLKDRQKQYNLSQKTVYVMPALQYCLLVISFRETKQCINQEKRSIHSMILLYVYVRYCNSTESTIKKDHHLPSCTNIHVHCTFMHQCYDRKDVYFIQILNVFDHDEIAGASQLTWLVC